MPLSPVWSSNRTSAARSRARECRRTMTMIPACGVCWANGMKSSRLQVRRISPWFRVGEHFLVHGVGRENLAQQRHFVVKGTEGVNQVLRYVLIEEELQPDPLTSVRVCGGHLPGDQEVDFSPVILVVSQTRINLGAGKTGKAVEQ